MIDIKHEKLCGCPVNHLNCLDAHGFVKKEIPVWSFAYEGRDVRNKDLHPATFPIALARSVIDTFTHMGELVVDPFVGSGTTLVAAADGERNAVGIELKEEYCKLAKLRTNQMKMFSDTEQIVVNDEAKNIDKIIKHGTVKLIFTSPPYGNILNKKVGEHSRKTKTKKINQVLQYSDNEKDLGTMEPIIFMETLMDIFKRAKKVLKKNGHVVININDVWSADRRIPLHSRVIDSMQEIGYIFNDTIIWDKRQTINNIGIIGWPSRYVSIGVTFEYLLHFVLND